MRKRSEHFSSDYPGYLHLSRANARRVGYNQITMVRIVEAIYSDGVLRPVETLELAERQRVRLTIEPVDPRSENERTQARRELIERLKRSKLSYGGALPTRDELHERDGHV